MEFVIRKQALIQERMKRKKLKVDKIEQGTKGFDKYFYFKIK